MRPKRLVFHEITREAIQEALKNPREIDTHLVEAQETRRKLDRLYGYEVSPVLWRKIAPRLSAGRVQSVAVRIIVEREEERRAFVRAVYWDLAGKFKTQDEKSLDAVLVSLGGKRLAIGKDFDPSTGKLRAGADKDVVLVTEDIARDPARRLKASAWRASRVEASLHGAAEGPFTTSTLRGEPQAAVELPRHDASGAAALRERPHHLHANRLDDALRAGDPQIAQCDRRDVRRAVPLPGAPAVPDQGEERAGGARGHPPVGRLPLPDDVAPGERRGLKPYDPSGREPWRARWPSREGTTSRSGLRRRCRLQANGKTIDSRVPSRLRRGRRRSRRGAGRPGRDSAGRLRR